MEATLRKLIKGLTALAVAASALVVNQGTATAQSVIVDANATPTTRAFYRDFRGGNGIVIFGAPRTETPAMYGGIPTVDQDPGDPRCLSVRGERVCSHVDLQPTSESTAIEIARALRENGGLYRLNTLVVPLINEIDARFSTVEPLGGDRLNEIRLSVTTALQGVNPNILRVACGDTAMEVCVPLPDVRGRNLADALRTISRRVREERASIACSFGCMTSDDVRFCREHGLGHLAAAGWNHSPNEDGGMARCTPGDDSQCARQSRVALQNYTCASLRGWYLDVVTQFEAARARNEAAAAEYRTAFLRETERRETELAAAQQPPPPPPAADRDNDTVADADDQCPDEAQGTTPDPTRPGCRAPELEVAPRRGGRRVARAPRRHRERRPTVEVAPPTPAPSLDENLEGMACSECVARGGGASCVAVCEVRPFVPGASAPFMSRVLRQASEMSQGPGTMPGLDHLAPRLRRHSRVIERILMDNAGAHGECTSHVILAAPASDHTREHPHYFKRRFGNCNGHQTDLASFITAATAAGANANHVVVWGHTGGRVRLRFRRDPFVAPPPEPEGNNPLPQGQGAQLLTPAHGGSVESDTRHAVASFDSTFNAINGADRTTATTNAAQMMTPGTTRTVLASRDFVRRPAATMSRFARPLPTPRLNARSTEVMARAPTVPDDNVSEIGPPLQATRCRVGMRCWWLRPTSAIA